ncbi:MAG: hypothetical protein KDJ69_13970 [Nitratireductor sp.]|nr:hypothetical protein [Nitratireductor sp.]
MVENRLLQFLSYGGQLMKCFAKALEGEQVSGLPMQVLNKKDQWLT